MHYAVNEGTDLCRFEELGFAACTHDRVAGETHCSLSRLVTLHKVAVSAGTFGILKFLPKLAVACFDVLLCGSPEFESRLADQLM
jgi:hypothetical protein